MTTTGTTGTTTSGTATRPRHPWDHRGRHRRPRPRARTALLTTGGLALAAGALSLVRLLPATGGTDAEGFRADAGPRVETGPGRDTATDGASAPAATRTAGSPEASPSATSALGGLGGSPEPGLPPGPSAEGPSDALRPSSTAVPETPDRHGTNPDAARPDARTPATRAPRSPGPPPGASTPPGAGAPAPPPSRGTPPPSPAPAPEPDDPGLCVPIIGLCVGLLGDDG
ncbi:hypothetical protein [Streptomyces mutabilis]|uniref:hypothetical protein n=1 Tax=Streptomyces mutabilis TaxID=67332 RepID=UPI0022BA4A32|nr:hypothetical protein [Streptomyces mutabilis]